ncbi:uncharacterized protein [Coffea arabica]|uniref:RNA-directed DNA polymerase n=1 Tax=Coffea arabica TaxID=13443 RepID=A0ABM4X0U1_COFAR
MYLEGRANNWFQGVKLKKPEISWAMFGELLCKRFDGRSGNDVIEEFNKLQQTGKLEEFQKKFEELKTLMMIKNPYLDEEYFVSNFISGLKDEIKTMIRMLKPATLSETFEMAILQENALRIHTRSPKETWKIAPESIFEISRNSPQLQGLNAHYRVPSRNTFRSTPFKGKPVTNTESEPRRISAQELQYRRANCLCFKCGEKFGQGHQYKTGRLNLLVTEEEKDSEFEDALEEQDESTGNPGQVMKMFLHVLSEALQRKTITLIGWLDGEEMLILVDTGNSDSYISSEKVIAFDIPYKLVDPFSVIVGNGACVTSKAICPKVAWEVNHHKFCYDLKVMDLSGWDIMLGMDWMTHFSPIMFEFHQLTIFLHNQGEMVQLRDQAENCDLDLIRGSDLRNFIEYKKQMCLAMRMGQETSSGGNAVPMKVQELIEKFTDVFVTPTELPPAREVDHEIPLKPGSQAFKLKPYRYPHSQKNEMEKQVADMLQHGIIIHSNSPFASPVLPTLELHLEHLQIVLTVLRQHQLFAKASKCSFAQQTVDYFNHTISENGVSMDQSKVESILNWPTPRYVKELRGFLGLTGYYRRFIKHYGIICKSLTELLRKDNFSWNLEAQKAFTSLKHIMCKAPVPKLPDFQKTFTIETDASGGGIGAVLMQEGHPRAFLSKALSTRNLGLSAYENELLALVKAVTKWKHYLVGYHFIIKTDHQSLKYLLDQKLTTALQHKWLAKLLGLDYEIQYKKGTDNKVADALSRLHGSSLSQTNAQGSCLALSTFKPLWTQELQGSYDSDLQCQSIKSQLILDPAAHPQYEWDSGLLKYNGKFYVGSSKGLREKIIQALHASAIGGHSGQRAYWQRIKTLFY